MKCLSMITLKNGIAVPCGRCPRCRRNRQEMWTFRLSAERDVSDLLFWLCLTIDDRYQARARNDPKFARQMTRHFFESIRKHFPKGYRFKHFLVSEYGDGTDRFHFHCCLFVRLPGDINILEAKKDIIDFLGIDTWDHSNNTCWPFGALTSHPFHSGVFPYVTDYINKPEILKDGCTHAVKPFTCISAGIGKSFLDRVTLSQFDDLDFITNYNGKRMILPRYYRDKIFPHSSSAVLKAFQNGDQAAVAQIQENIQKWQEKLTTIEQEQVDKQTRRLLDFDRLHSIDYGVYLENLKKEEERRYINKLKKRSQL